MSKIELILTPACHAKLAKIFRLQLLILWIMRQVLPGYPGKMVRHYLANAAINAPFTGIVVEGDLTEMLGAPVRKGELGAFLHEMDKLRIRSR